MEEVKSATGGVKPFPIQGRLSRERERLAGGMTDAERKMRAQWIKDQVLAPHEPVYVPEIEQELMNPIRRFYRKPLDVVFKALEPTLGKEATSFTRHVTGRMFMCIAAIYGGVYYFKYCKNDWTRASGWRVTMSRSRCLPGDPGFPQVSNMKPNEYNTRGFENSPI